MMVDIPFRPRVMDSFKNYSREDFVRDLIAGVTVGIVALPLAMAFGIASGVDPKAGIYTAIVAGFIISLLGGSRVQIGGPTGAFIAIVYGVIAQYGLANLMICTIMAGVILMIMGFAKMGTMIKYIPHPVTTGFTCGIAVLIFSTQLKDFLGLQLEGGVKMPSDFVDKIKLVVATFRAHGAQAMDWRNFALAAGSLTVILAWPKRFARRVPGSVIALVLGTVVVMVFGLEQRWSIPTIGSQFGGIPRGLPPLTLPHDVSLHDIQGLFRPALTIALLAAIESLLCAVVADGMIDDRHDSNTELIAQGLANVGSAFFGGIPATGAIARTATNVKNGGRTPLAGLVHAVTLLIIILVAAPLAAHIPLATLSAVLVMVAVNMGEWRLFSEIWRWPKSDTSVFLAAFGLTVLVDLVAAVEVGMVLAAVLFIKRISETTKITSVDKRSEEDTPGHSLVGKEVPKDVMIYRIFGAFFFGAADKLETALKRVQQEPKVLILHMRKVLAMDATGLNALENMHHKMRARGRHLILSGPHTQPLIMMERAGMIDSIGRENMCGDIDSALIRAKEILAQEQMVRSKLKLTQSIKTGAANLLHIHSKPKE
jgi:SulP family sulfate permease